MPHRVGAIGLGLRVFYGTFKVFAGAGSRRMHGSPSRKRGSEQLRSIDCEKTKEKK